MENQRSVRSPRREPLRSILTLELHTGIAHDYIRSHHNPDRPESRQPGLIDFNRRVGGVLSDSARNNPFADWCLIRIEMQLDRLLETIRSRREELNDKVAAEPLPLQVATPPAPHRERIMFSSPYTYSVALAIKEFDEIIQTATTAVHTGSMASNDRAAVIQSISGKLRSVLMMPHHYLRTRISRGTMDHESSELIRDMQQRLGGVMPDDVRSGERRAKYAPPIALFDHEHEDESDSYTHYPHDNGG